MNREVYDCGWRKWRERRRRAGFRVYANLCILDRTTPTWLRPDASVNYPIRARRISYFASLCDATSTNCNIESRECPNLAKRQCFFTLQVKLLKTFFPKNSYSQIHGNAQSLRKMLARERTAFWKIKLTMLRTSQWEIRGVKGTWRLVVPFSFYGCPLSGISRGSRHEKPRLALSGELAIFVPDKSQTSRHPRRHIGGLI